MFGDSTVSFAFLYDFLHKLAITVNINDSSPIFNPNNKHLNFDSPLYIRFLADLQMLKFKHCCLVSLHTGHQPFDFKILPSEVILDKVAVHQVES